MIQGVQTVHIAQQHTTLVTLHTIMPYIKFANKDTDAWWMKNYELALLDT